MAARDTRSEGGISFRPPHVARWWYDDASWRGVQEEYTLYIEGRVEVPGT
jgi:hypothetical protein